MKIISGFITKKQIINIIIIIIIGFILYKIFNVLLNKIVEKSKNELDRKRKNTIVIILRNIIKYTIILLILIIILDLYGVNVNSLLASLGIASAVSALALQDTLKDIINGISLIMDNYYVVGDYVKYENFIGEVIYLGLRSTKIKSFQGEVLTIANRNIIKVINLSQKKASPLLKIPTSYEAKIEKVEKVINEIVEEIKTWPTMDTKLTRYVGVVELADSCINYGIRFYCSPGKVWQYKRDILRLIKIKYDENNIEIPYPQIEVHYEK